MRNGKIARLPGRVREQINEMLHDNIPGPRILSWVNSLPETQRLVDSRFAGVAVSKHNLSEWRTGAYQAWCARKFVMQIAGDLRERDVKSRRPGRGFAGESRDGEFQENPSLSGSIQASSS